MKTPILAAIFVALSGALASAAEFSVFRVCQDQRVIRTSDGAEAGHVEYIVVDPSSREVVSTVVTGGVIGERLVAIPYDSLRFDGDREITLNEITRERLVSAPVIERTQISASVIEPGVIEHTRTHFHARAEGPAGRNATEPGAAATGRPNEARPNAEAPGRGNPQAETGRPNNADGEIRRQQEERKGNRPDAAAETNRERPNAAPETNNPRNGANKNGETPAAKTNKPNAVRPENNAEPNQPNAPAPESTKPTRDANDRSKAQQAERDAENARAQQNEPNNTKGERKGPADRNANEESAAGRKPAEENPEATGKRPPKKATEPGEEKRRQEQPPQL